MQSYKYNYKVIFFEKALDNITIKLYNIIKERETGTLKTVKMKGSKDYDKVHTYSYQRNRSF